MVLDMGYDPPDRNPGKPWLWMVLDSLIIAGIAFISTLPGNRLPELIDLYVAVKAFVYAFLIQLAVERGLKPIYYRREQRDKKENHNQNSKQRIHKVLPIIRVLKIGRSKR